MHIEREKKEKGKRKDRNGGCDPEIAYGHAGGRERGRKEEEGEAEVIWRVIGGDELY